MVQFIPKANPSPLPANGYRVALSNNVLAVATNQNTKSSLYHVAPLQDAVAFTTQSPDTSGTNTDVKISPQGDLLYTARPFADYIYSMNHENETYTDIGPLPSVTTGQQRSCFSADGKTLVRGSTGSPFLNVWQIASGVVTKVANPATLPAGKVVTPAISPDGSLIACSMDGAPYLALYSFSGGVLTKLPDPMQMPPSASTACAFSPDGKYLFVNNNPTPPRYTVYEIDGTTFTKISGITSINANTVYAEFSPDGKMIAAGGSSRLEFFDFNNGILTLISDLTVTGNFLDAAFSPDGSMFAVVGATTPFVRIWDVIYPEPSNIKAFMGEDELEGIRVGTTEVTRAYVGSEQVFGD